MQEWLKDKKNLPIVAAVGALVLIGAIALILFETGVLPPKPAPTSVPVASSSKPGLLPGVLPPGAMPPGVPPSAGLSPQMRPGGFPGVAPGGAFPAPGVAGQASPLAAGATKTPAPPLNAAKGPDPFNVPGYHPFRVSQGAANASRLRNSLPPVFIQKYPNKDRLLPGPRSRGATGDIVSQTPEVSSSMRMSGVITSDTSIKALLESNGVSTQVQPGDTVNGGKVLSIQPDGLTLRTSDNRLVRVPLSGTPTGGNSPYGGGYPGNGSPDQSLPGINPIAPPQ